MMKNRNKSTLGWLCLISGRKKWNIIWLLLVQMTLGISGVGAAWLLRGMIDCAAAKAPGGFIRYAALLLGVVLCQILLRAANRFLEEYSKASLENCFKGRLFSSLLERDYAAVTAMHSGEWMNRLTSDTVVAAEGLTLILPGAAGMMTRMMGALILIVILAPGFAWALIPGGLLLMLFTYLFRGILKKLHREVQEADGRLRVFLSERIGNLLIVRSFARERQTMREAEAKMADHKRARMRKNHFSNICNIGFGGVMQGAYVLGAVYCGYGILTGAMTYGTFAAILELIGQIQSPFANITGYLPKFYAMLASAERLMEVETYAVDLQNTAPDREEIHHFYETQFAAIGLERAAFTYLPPVRQANGYAKADRPVVIENVNLQIKKGEYVGFTGQSGCGKSTILKLLMCLYPLDHGNRYIQLADGGRIPLESRHRRLFAYVPQGSQLMSGTIREIVAFSDENRMRDEEAIWRSLKIACAQDYIRELKDGIDTVLGERGLGLSEGQMQRIAIARAIFSEHPILMLDESTSALDEETERRLLENLRSMTDKTVLIVTHRPAVLAICDRQMIVSPDGIEIKEKKEDRNAR